MKLDIFDKNLKFKHVEFGNWNIKDVLLCCPGPSLKDLPDNINRPGLLVVAINTAYPKVRPDIWIGMDTPECYNSSLIKESFVKIFRECYSNATMNGGPLHSHYNSYFCNVEEHPDGIMGMFDLSFPFIPWHKNTLAAAIAILIRMGVENIYLAGCDMGGAKDYYDDRVLEDKQKEKNRRLYEQQVDFIAQLYPLARTKNINIISATKDSPLNTFIPHVDPEELLKSFPLPEYEETKHVCKISASIIEQQVQKVKWVSRPEGEGVLLMCDSDQEYLLEWWYGNFRKHNPNIPIHFVDIGMTEKAIRWCKSVGTVSKLPDLKMKNWFKKPYALMQSPFKKTVYIDCDTEICGSIANIFMYADFGIGLSMDVQTRFTVGNTPVNTGVIAYKTKNEIVNGWASDTTVNNFYFRSDQEILQAYLDNHINPFIEIPERYNWVRSRGKNDNAVILHWTGDEGKNIIKQKIEKLTHDIISIPQHS